jgi:hypothetical protein
MCAQCVSKVDVVVGSVGFTAFVLRDPVKAALVEFGIIPEPHPLSVEMRTVHFLRGLDLDPVPIMGEELVREVDVALAYPRRKVYRRSFREALTFLFGGSMRSQSLPVVQ